MILERYRYLSTYNEYCQVNVEVSYLNMKLIIGIRESGRGNWFLVPYLSKRLGYFKTIKSETGIGEPGNSSLFIILMYNTNVSKVQIGNKEPVLGSFLTIIGSILVSGFVYFISMKGIK